MKILHVISSMDPLIGGPSQGIRNYETALAGKDVERHVVCLDEPNDVKTWNNFSLKIYALGKSVSKWQYNKKLSLWLEENLAHYDAVIINGLWLFSSYITTKVIKKLKDNKIKAPKVFIMPHGMLDPWFQKAKSRYFKAVRNYIYWELIEKKIVNSADGLLFTCQTEMELSKNTFRDYFPKQEINIGYGIETPPAFTQTMANEFSKKCPQLQQRKYLLFLSRIHEKKGLDLLILAYKHILEIKGMTNILPDLIIAGPNIDSKYGVTVRNIVNDSALLVDKVHFVGMLAGNAKWGAFYGCEGFVLSSHQENFGIAVVESLACGKPVLITEEVNIWKEIKNSNAGLVCKNNLLSITKMIVDFCELEDLKKKSMSLQARITFEENFNVTKVVDNFIEALTNTTKNVDIR